jgi:outer membrane receptor protein involved in Fe transport
MFRAHIFAQAAAAALPEAAATPVEGVISYPPSFFAASRPVNVFEMIERVPGFNFDGGDDVRGFEGAAGNVLIDGQRPSSKSDSLEDILRRMPVAQVERIELIRGGAPGVDMQGKTVLLNVVRKAGGGLQGLIAIANNHIYDGRDAPQLRVEGSGNRDGRSWELSVRGGMGVDDGAGEGDRVRLDRLGNPLIRSFVDSEGTSYFTNGAGSYEMPLAGGKLRVNGRLATDKFKYKEVNEITFPSRFDELNDFTDKEFETELGLRYSREFGPRTSLEVVGIHQTEADDFVETFASPDGTSRFDQSTENGESIGRAVLKFRQNDRLSWEGGGEIAFNWLDGDSAYQEDGQPVDLPAAHVRVEELRGEMFGKAVWRPTAQWTLEGGLRQEASAISSDADATSLEKELYFTKPRLAATWAPSERVQVRLRFERVVGQLDFNDFVASSSLNEGQVLTGNPDLEPEQAWVSEAAFERRFWGSGAVVLTLRHSALSDAIDRAPIVSPGGGVFDAPANIGDGTKNEVALSLTLPLDRLGLKGAQLRGEGTRRWSEVTDPTTLEKREISGLRPLEWEAHFTHDLPQWRATWGVDAFGAWRETYYRFDQVQTDKLRTYVLAFIEWKAQPDLSVRMEVANATSRGFRHTRYRYEGLRGSTPLSYVDDRDIQFGRMLFVRVRKTFGG